ncbi:MAG: chemotaxis protein CheW [Bacteroidota bacterium]|nr:chemotaxis protein CheW [Bacteroidota bacterium]
MLKLEDINQLVVFWINRQRFAIRLSDIRQIIRAVEITPIPNAPEKICGIINLHGTVVPVMNMHFRVGLRGRITDINDRFIIVNASGRVVALRVDKVAEVIYDAGDHFVNAEEICSGLDISGIISSDDGLILIYNLETFLTTEEIIFLDKISEDNHSNEVGIAGSENN